MAGIRGELSGAKIVWKADFETIDGEKVHVGTHAEGAITITTEDIEAVTILGELLKKSVRAIITLDQGVLPIDERQMANARE